MTRLAMVAVLLGACHHNLDPGETECRTVGFGRFAHTRCRTGQDQPATGWWCSTRSDGFGECSGAGPGDCEAFRERSNAALAGSPGTGWGECRWQQTAICANYTCYTSASWCAEAERAAGRDVRACEAKN